MLKLLRGGNLLKIEYNGDKRIEHHVKRQDNQFVVINNKTNQTIHTANTKDEAFDIFNETVPIINIIAELTQPCEIEENVTLGDIFSLIEANPELTVFLETIFPYYQDISSKGYNPKKLVFGSYLKINENHVEEIILQSAPPSKDFMDVPVIFNNSRNIQLPNKIYPAISHTHTLMEMFKILFTPHHHFPNINFTKEGVINEETNEPIDNPIKYLFSPCTLSNITLKDIFEYVDQNELLKVFIKYYSACQHIDAFHKESRLPYPENYKQTAEITEVYHNLKLELNPKKSNSCNYYYSFHGKATKEAAEE